MTQGSAEISNKVTVLVFKDNYAARTFQVPLSWISRLGILLGIFFGLSLASVAVAIKYYQIAKKTDPFRVQDLEFELAELKNHTKKIDPPFSAPSTVAAPPSSLNPLTFTAFPPQVQLNLPDPSTLSFSIKTPKAYWKNKKLYIQFALQYDKSDGGNQQGLIVVLARGSENILGYPAGVFDPRGGESLIHYEKGEPFSVGKYREVKAEFDPVRSRTAIQQVEIFIFAKDPQILAYQKLTPTLPLPEALVE